jgi:hypothetical protein
LILPAASVYERFASYHTALANPAELKSFWDILQPTWKGKIVATDVKTGEGRNGARFLFHHPELGPAYLRRLLTEMDITYSRDYRQATDWLTGALPCICSSQFDDTVNAKGQGPCKFSTRASGRSRPRRHRRLRLGPAAHPRRRRVLLNWLLSRDGQIALQRDSENAGGMTAAHRHPEEHVNRSRAQRRRQILEMWNPSWLGQKPELKS